MRRSGGLTKNVLQVVCKPCGHIYPCMYKLGKIDGMRGYKKEEPIGTVRGRC